MRNSIYLKEILNTNLFDLEKASQSAGWMKELMGELTPETEEYGISSFVYRAKKPFHPARISELLQSKFLEGVLRSKGWIWLASRPEFIATWAQAGRVTNISPEIYWHSQYNDEGKLTIAPEAMEQLIEYKESSVTPS